MNKSVIPRSLVFCCFFTLLLTIITTPTFGQGSQADYDRAEALAAKSRGKVFRARVQPHWLEDGARFWYRVDVGPERHRFILVDAAEGTRQDLFDHVKLAEKLRSEIGGDYQPEELPLSGIRVKEDSIEFHVTGEGAWRWNPKDSTLEQVDYETENESTVAILPYPRRTYRTGEATSITFLNRTEQRVEIFWMSTDSRKQSYATLEPGGRHEQHTYEGHVWLATDSDEKPVGIYEATEMPGVAVIDGSWRRGEVRAGRRDRDRRRRRGSRESPDERWEANIEDHNVVITNQETDEEFKLTSDGTAENSYQRRFYWSPDSSTLLVIQEEQGENREIHFVESSPDDSLQPKLHTVEYTKPGDRIDHPRPRLFCVATREPIPISEELFDNPWSLSQFRWAEDSSRFTFLYNERGHQLLRLVAVDAESGEATALIEETSDTFVCYSSKLFLEHIEESGEMIWMSERDGWNHLYLYDDQGHLKNQITSGDWVVREVERVDEKKRQLWFRAGRIHPEQDPYHVHYARVDFDGSNLTLLTEGNGTHDVEFSPDGKTLVDRYSRVDLPPITELRSAEDGRLICKLEEAQWDALRETGWQPPLRFCAKGRDGETDIYGVIYRPTTFDPEKKYPVIESIYAGPQSAHVPKRFAPHHGPQSLAELGFVVVQIDGMGTSHRSKAFHDVCWHDLGDAGFPDRVCWIKAAAEKHPWMDISRVGIYGGSAGGQNAMRALIAHNDFYQVACADCGCHDNRMDKIWWNEQWMGWPVGPHYAESSNVEQAHRMEGKLLLIVGELDRNVDPASTMQVVDALIKADKDFDLLVIPGSGHGAGSRPYGMRRQRDFFVRHLLGVEPRWE